MCARQGKSKAFVLNQPTLYASSVLVFGFGWNFGKRFRVKVYCWNFSSDNLICWIEIYSLLQRKNRVVVENILGLVLILLLLGYPNDFVFFLNRVNGSRGFYIEKYNE